ncbi:hypothetical protein [Flavobacterium soli]|uniref:hypothetical protein n=1 Tax=Flavobacterium soli TaxID=344881 RepID=UPI0003FDCD8B|nr:hypothetical protein [Flavobacterium soli]
MKLSEQQIEQLYTFTRQHYVEWYDLQTELVDHLANAIEAEWKQNPKLTFEEALHLEFKKFGVFGFMDVVEKREAVLNKKYSRLVLSELKNFFSIPKIVLTFLAIGIVFYMLKSFQESFLILQILFVLTALACLIGLWSLSRNIKRNNKQSGKKWLFKDIIFGYGSFTGFINLPIQFSIHFEGINYSEWFLLVCSFLLIVFILLEYIVLVLIPSKAEEYLLATYPEYEIAS